ncbi:MAG TPA: ABC transporter substrate-binding protein [Stellaceae bacterium]|nr:ABC transporter substrate-binding protein [Stellaceae bacterium]
MLSRLRPQFRQRASVAARALTLASLIALLAPTAGFAAGADKAATPRRGGTLDFAVESEPSNYDCHANVSFAFMHPVAPHYSTLLKFDAPNYPAIKGDLAESWSVSPDKRTYTFKLRPNVLFHDGSRLTSADVKASYERIVNPPEGVFSARRASYAAISSIETPDARTVVFHLSWPEAAMLANFASPWNCIYSAAKLALDPQFPKTHILGTGPFVFVEHVEKSHWTGKRFDKYFEPGKPYLDGYVAHFMKGEAVIAAIEHGDIQGQFRSVTPAERDRLVAAMGDKVQVSETPWLINLLIDFNAKHPPFDDARVRRALSLAIDRWRAAAEMAGTSYLKFVGGILRPGFSMATPEAELATLPGLSHDIAASRAEAKRLLAEAGVKNLSFTLVNRDIPLPYGPAADYVIAAWRAIGVTATEKKLNTKEWEAALHSGAFDVAFDFGGDYFDDPTQQLERYISPDLTSVNFSGGTDRTLDAFFVGQAVTSDPRQRTKIVREFERRVFEDSYVVPLLWWNRIIANSSRLRGWAITPSHYLNQDLADVWLAPPEQRACAGGKIC